MGPDDELIFIEGNSTDDTWETICGCSRNIRVSAPFGSTDKRER